MTCPGNRHQGRLYGDCIRCDKHDASSRSKAPAMTRVDGAWRCEQFSYTPPVDVYGSHRFAPVEVK